MSPSFHRRVLLKTVRFFDLSLLGLTFFASFTLSSGTFSWPTLSHLLLIRISVANLIVFAAYLGMCSLVLSGCGFYRSHRLSARTRTVREVFLASTILTGLIFIARAPLELSFATAGFLLTFWLLTLFVYLLSRELMGRMLQFARAHGRNLRNIVVIGEGSVAVDVARRLSNDTGLGYRILQIIDTKRS